MADPEAAPETSHQARTAGQDLSVALYCTSLVHGYPPISPCALLCFEMLKCANLVYCLSCQKSHNYGPPTNLVLDFKHACDICQATITDSWQLSAANFACHDDI